MKLVARFTLLLLLLAGVVCLAGCESMGEPMAEQQSQAEPQQASQQEQAKQPETAPSPEAEKLSVEQMQARRELEVSLVKDVEEYYKRVAARNVDSALEYVEADRRADMQKQLWAFISNYSIESFEIAGSDVKFFDTPWAMVTVKMTLFEKRSVVPQQKQVEQEWGRGEDRWLLLSDQ